MVNLVFKNNGMFWNVSEHHEANETSSHWSFRERVQALEFLAHRFQILSKSADKTIRVDGVTLSELYQQL